MARYRVAVIVLNFRGAKVLPLCIASLTDALHSNDQVLIVDNGVEDTLLASMKNAFPSVQTLSLSENGGFSKGMNAGIRYIQDEGGADAYWLLNNDTIVEPSTIEELLSAQRKFGTENIFSPVIHTAENGPIWFAGGKIDFFRMRTRHFHQLSKKTPFVTGFLTGCALFIPAQALSLTGFLDERYFLYAEDAEFSFRAKRRGLGLWVVPNAIVYHSEESEKNPKKLYWLIRSSAEFFLRESPLAWKPWVWAYYGLRRIKNRLRLLFRVDPLASEIERAYTDVSL